MNSKNPTGYCPNCQQDVLLVREEFEVCLAIFLLIFTAGIGFIIYLIVYLRRAEDRCVHCGTKITIIQSHYSQSSSHLPTQQYKYNYETQKQQISSATKSAKKNETEYPKFCAFCGEELKSTEAKFCPNCGTELG